MENVMEIKGKIIQVFPVVTGTGKKGGWAKQEFVLQTEGQYPKKVCIAVWGQDKIDKYDLESAIDITVTASIELESREYNGRWYTEARAWKIEWDTNQKRKWTPGGERMGAPASDDREPQPQRDNSLLSTTDDLPF